MASLGAAPRVVFSSAYFRATRNISLGFFFLFFKVSKLVSILWKKSSHSPSFSTTVTPAQKFWIYTDALRNPVQYCMTRGTLGMSVLL